MKARPGKETWLTICQLKLLSGVSPACFCREFCHSWLHSSITSSTTEVDDLNVLMAWDGGGSKVAELPWSLVHYRWCNRLGSLKASTQPPAGLPAENLDLPPSEQFFSKNVQFCPIFGKISCFYPFFGHFWPKLRHFYPIFKNTEFWKKLVYWLIFGIPTTLAALCASVYFHKCSNLTLIDVGRLNWPLHTGLTLTRKSYRDSCWQFRCQALTGLGWLIGSVEKWKIHVFLNGYSFSYVFTYKLSGNITLFDVLQCLVGWLFISKFPIFTF